MLNSFIFGVVIAAITLLLINKRKKTLFFANDEKQKLFSRYLIHKQYIKNKYQHRQLPRFDIYSRMAKKEMDLTFIGFGARPADFSRLPFRYYYFKEYDFVAVTSEDESDEIVYIVSKNWQLSYRLKFIKNQKHAVYVGNGVFFEGDAEDFENAMSILKLKSV